MSSRCAKEMVNPHRRSIGGRHGPSEKILSPKLNSYADANGWDDLVHVFIGSLDRSSLDEEIQ